MWKPFRGQLAAQVPKKSKKAFRQRQKFKQESKGVNIVIDLTGKFITTTTNEESERLLRMASARGYRTDIGLKALVNKRFFYFSEFLKQISTPTYFHVPGHVYTYQELFGEEDGEYTV